MLAAALLVAVVLASISILYATVVNERRVVGDAATQLLTALFGGIVGILGAYIGAGSAPPDDTDHDLEKEEEE
jgi:hypothetical protein